MTSARSCNDEQTSQRRDVLPDLASPGDMPRWWVRCDLPVRQRPPESLLAGLGDYRSLYIELSPPSLYLQLSNLIAGSHPGAAIWITHNHFRLPSESVTHTLTPSPSDRAVVVRVPLFSHSPPSRDLRRVQGRGDLGHYAVAIQLGGLGGCFIHC